MNNIMIDIETLGRIPDGAIVQIAAIKFDPMTGFLGESFSVNIDPVSSQENGMSIDADTVKFWFQQSENARELVFGGELVSLKDGLSNFYLFLQDIPRKDRIVWANGAQFDLNIIKSAIKICGYNDYWEWRNERDARTIYKLFPLVRDSHEFIGEPHNGLDDCKNQVAILHECFKRIYN